MAAPGQVQVGQLFNGGKINGIVVYKQPGGVGTLVYPQFPRLFPERYQGYPQSPFSYPAQSSWGCGHAANTAEVFQYFDPYQNNGEGEQMCAICCSMCGYVQQILTVEQYHSYIYTPIVTA